MQRVPCSLVFGSLLLLVVNAAAFAQLPELSSEESRQLSVLLGDNDANRQTLAQELSKNLPSPIIAHLCFHATQSQTQQVALESLVMLNAEYGKAVRVLITGGPSDERLTALLTLRSFGYQGRFALPAIEVEAERGRRLLESSNRDGWRRLDEQLRKEVTCYKLSLWVLSQYEPSEKLRDFLLNQADFEIKTTQPNRTEEVEALLFAEGEAWLFDDSRRTDWYAGAYSAIGMLAATSRPLRPKIVEHLQAQLQWASPIRKIQSARTLTTCGTAAAPALEDLIRLERFDEDPRVREAVGKALEMIKLRIEAANLIGEGKDFNVLINMLASRDDSANRIEAFEWIDEHEPGLFRFALNMFRNRVKPSHYRRLQEALNPQNLQMVSVQPLAMLLEYHSQHLMQVNALVIGEAADDAARQLLESETSASKMDLVAHQLQLLGKIYGFDLQLSQLSSSMNRYETAITLDQRKSVLEATVGVYRGEAKDAVREQMFLLVLARSRNFLMQHVVNEESLRNELTRQKTLEAVTFYLELLIELSAADPELKTKLCEYLFSDLHLLYIGGPGNDSGHLFDVRLIDLYLTALKKLGELPKQRALEFEERAKAWANDAAYSPQVRKQIARYDGEVMSRIRDGAQD